MKILDSARRRYWDVTKSLNVWSEILTSQSPQFRKIVLSEHLRNPRKLRPVYGETAQRAQAAVTWLFNAQEASGDNGASYGFFPLSQPDGWEVSYPETTGYIITSLLRYAQKTGQPEAAERAHRMALWESEVQMSSGAVQGGKLTTRDKQTPATFNTGMVLDGFVTLLEDRPDPVILRAAERAADFLIGDLTEQGLFATNGEFVSRNAVKIYNVLCAWAMHRFGRLTETSRYCNAAIKAVEAALRFQNERGWFAENCLTDPVRPLTHTIGYSAQGVLEVGIDAQREDFIAAAERCFASLAVKIYPNGFLPARFDDQWRQAAQSACLTGSAQMAIVGYRLCKILKKPAYGEASDKLTNFLKAVQRINTGFPGVDGALAGSFPIMGEYMTGGYPNWATKYLLDALMLQADRSGEPLTV